MINIRCSMHMWEVFWILDADGRCCCAAGRQSGTAGVRLAGVEILVAVIVLPAGGAVRGGGYHGGDEGVLGDVSRTQTVAARASPTFTRRLRFENAGSRKRWIELDKPLLRVNSSQMRHTPPKLVLAHHEPPQYVITDYAGSIMRRSRIMSLASRLSIYISVSSHHAEIVLL